MRYLALAINDGALFLFVQARIDIEVSDLRVALIAPGDVLRALGLGYPGLQLFAAVFTGTVPAELFKVSCFFHITPLHIFIPLFCEYS